MAERPNLLEYLAKPIRDVAWANTTEITEADQDEYDAPDSTATAASLGSDFAWAGTWNTRADGDTYDDDPGLGALGVPRLALETIKTAMSADTYDNDVDGLSATIPAAGYVETYVTKVENETYDDNPSAEGLSFPVT